jgi:hypothetical protein
MENSKNNSQKNTFNEFFNQNIEMIFIKSFLSFDIIKLSNCLIDNGRYLGLSKNEFSEYIYSIFKENKYAKIEYFKNFSDLEEPSEVVHTIKIVSNNKTTEFNLLLSFSEMKISRIKTATSYINENEFDYKQLYN